MDNLSFGKMNLMSTGNSAREACRAPRHSAGMACQLSRSVFPANGPLATRDSNAVSHASPRGSFKFILLGYHGASEHWPQIRGLKKGSRRDRTGCITV